jgi:tight adherence protein C
MSPAITLGLALLIIVGVLVFVYYSYQGNDALRRLAELNLDQPSESAGSVAIHKLLDDTQTRSLARRLSEAGWYNVTPVQMFGYMLIGVGIGAVLGVLLAIARGKVDSVSILVFVILAVCGILFPNAMVDRAIGIRKRAVQRELPNLLDMVSTAVEAGTALSQALIISMDAIFGPLRKELELVNDDIRLGRSRSEALAAMAHRVREPDLTTSVTAIVQADRLGGNISEVLQSLAHEARERRMLRAEEIAGTLPVKMVFPMVFFMLPSLVIIIFGSVFAHYTR